MSKATPLCSAIMEGLKSAIQSMGANPTKMGEEIYLVRLFRQLLQNPHFARKKRKNSLESTESLIRGDL